MVPLQLAYLIASAYALPSVCPLTSGYLDPFPCLPLIAACQALLLVVLPGAVIWWQEREGRLAFQAVHTHRTVALASGGSIEVTS